MKRLSALLFVALLLLPSWVAAEGVLTQAANPPSSGTLYDYRTSLLLQDDFLSGSAANTNIGHHGWSINGGTATAISSESGRIGLIRRSTTAIINSVSAMYLGSGSIIPNTSITIQRLFVARLNESDANTTVRVGAMDGIVQNPPTHGVYLEKLDGDTNWFCVTRIAGVQTRVDTSVAVTTASFTTFDHTVNSAGVQFKLNGVAVCGVMTTNLPTALLDTSIQITTSAAAAKTIDIDYFEMRITGITR